MGVVKEAFQKIGERAALSIAKRELLKAVEPFNAEDIKKAVKENINLLDISLQHIPTKQKLLFGQDIAYQFPEAYDMIKDVHIIDWFIECRSDMIKNLDKKELNWVLQQTRMYMDWLWKK